MPVSDIFENLESGALKQAVERGSTNEKRYTILGTDNELEAKAALLSYAPMAFDGKQRGECSVDPEGWQKFKGTAQYIEPERRRSGFTFDTTGGTTHITQGRDEDGPDVYFHIADPGKPPNFGGAIGAKGKGADQTVDGIDITVPALKFSVSKIFEASEISSEYVKMLARVTGTTNKSAWGAFAPGELKFMGVSGQKNDTGKYEFTFNFEASQNAAPGVLKVPGIDSRPIEKKGHQYLWVHYEPKDDPETKRTTCKPAAVFVHTVYPESEFADLGITAEDFFS